MRKAIIYMIGVILWATSCDSSIMEYPEDGGVDPTKVQVVLTFAVDPSLEPYSKAEGTVSSDEASTHDVRWIVEIFRDRKSVV